MIDKRDVLPTSHVPPTCFQSPETRFLAGGAGARWPPAAGLGRTAPATTPEKLAFLIHWRDGKAKAIFRRAEPIFGLRVHIQARTQAAHAIVQVQRNLRARLQIARVLCST